MERVERSFALCHEREGTRMEYKRICHHKRQAYTAAMSTKGVSKHGILALRFWTFTWALAITMAFPALARAERVQITASRLVVRKGPGAEEEKVGSATKGKIYEVLERRGQWVKIRFGPKGGWVHAMHTQKTERKAPAEEPSGEPGDAGEAGVGTHRVVPLKLNVRKAPGQKSPIAFHLIKGVKVTVAETQGDWSKITHRGRSGWAMTKYLTRGQAAKPASPPRRVAPRQPPPRRPAMAPPRRPAMQPAADE